MSANTMQAKKHHQGAKIKLPLESGFIATDQDPHIRLGDRVTDAEVYQKKQLQFE